MRMLGAVLIVVALTVSSEAQTSPHWSVRLEKAALDGATRDLMAIRADLQKQVAAPGAGEALIRYALAYASFRMVNLPDVPAAERKDLLSDAVTQLQDVIKKNANDAEAHALLGVVYGLQIAESPIIRGMTLGPRATAALERAAEIESGNPRVFLVQGISAFNTPAMFGGGTDKAERLLRQSLDRFAAEPADKPWPNWGRFDAHVWLGQALLQRGDRAGARAEYDQARSLAPSSGWLRYVLMPALEAKK